jgi:hypothetical protein
MNCDNCSIKGAEPVPYIVHESAMARQERTIKRLWIALIICIVGLIGMFIYEAQFETVTTTIEAEQESETGSNYAVGGDYTYGTAENTDYNETPNP